MEDQIKLIVEQELVSATKYYNQMALVYVMKGINC